MFSYIYLNNFEDNKCIISLLLYMILMQNENVTSKYFLIFSLFSLIRNKTKAFLKNHKTIIIILKTIENINKQRNQEKILNRLIILYVYFWLFFIDFIICKCLHNLLFVNDRNQSVYIHIFQEHTHTHTSLH